MRLNEDNPEVFQLFHNFIFTGYVTDNTRVAPGVVYTVVGRPVRLSVEEKVNECASKLSDNGVELSFSMLIKIAAFADVGVVPTLMDTACSLIMQKVISEGYIPLSLIEDTTELLPRGCNLRLFLGTAMLFGCNKVDFVLHKDSLPPTLVADVASAQLTRFDEIRIGEPEYPHEFHCTVCLLHSKCSKKIC